ncbi:multicopper oxidase domain-containing protein [Thalassomonas viridans]|uniref:Multicopper oxidase domain-containing protein n=1 Tax=Thalassomonas viridans TaxID=137584 RepID=A0AAF0C7C8_9GAMM|nr:multicopper oxidase domain-containing protein [Thalassomonas viridans]WDE03211.1 multicopper oxidase domain-containing protein [Thalassomonas viridans]
MNALQKKHCLLPSLPIALFPGVCHRGFVQLAVILLLILPALAGLAGCKWEINSGSDDSAEVVEEEDNSLPTGPQFGDLPEGLPPANRGAFEGGATGTGEDTSINNVLPKGKQQDNGYFNIPTNGAPSPLFGAEPFSQPMLRFEEFGLEPLMLDSNKPANWQPLPSPTNSQSLPDSARLDQFLTQAIWPIPSVAANTQELNPWQSQIQNYLGRALDKPPAEGRPPGVGWSHQRWSEFTPTRYFQTATTGARANAGLRDGKQDHRYQAGEFASGGLYHNTGGGVGTAAGVQVRFHPHMPLQEPNALWTFDGTFPPKLLKVRYGESLIMRHYNALPIDVAANRGFGVHTLSTHEHNGHNPAESDGYTNAFFFPGQFFDYRWPMVLAGHDSINTDAAEPRAGAPDGNGGIRQIPGDWRETMSTHWFHDHMLDFTAQNVYKGSVAMMNYYSALDRGNEALDDGVNLRLPSGSALDWGNRDYDVNLLLAEKAWDSEGQLWFNPFNVKGFVGDVMTVNWLYKPYFEVRARQYRFRILNGSVSRYFKLALVDGEGSPVPFYLIANDGNIMEHTVYFENGELPTLGIAERYDIIVDFSAFEAGDKLYLVNMLQHKNGQVTDEVIPLADIISGDYYALAYDDEDDGRVDRWMYGDPVVGKFLEFRVQSYQGEDKSMNPADFVAGKKTLIPLNRPDESELANALHRTFEFERQPTDDKPWVIETDGGKGLTMDPRRLSAAPDKNSGGIEVWRLVNSGSWSHPVHIHFEEGIILRRDGKEPPEWEKWARKDVYRLGPQPDSGSIVEIALRFREFAGTYMEHCHNTQHEDHAMLLRWDVENPGQTKLMPTPIPSWDGVGYVDTVALPTARIGDGTGQYGPALEPVSIWVAGTEIGELDNIRDHAIGDALSAVPPDNERGTATFALKQGTNIDDQGVETQVWYFLHDVSDKALADELGLAWAGALAQTAEAATALASVTEDGEWIFYGDLPNPVWANDENPEGIPAVDDNNSYSPLRRVNYGGKDVVFNAVIIKWGDKPWQHNRIDKSCRGFPDLPANTRCLYNGEVWGGLNASGHVLELVTEGDNPHVTFKLHKSWAGEGDYLPYYVVLDTFPFGPAKAMGVPYVPKHKFLGAVAVPLIQFIPPAPIRDSYPPTPSDGMGILGGGPFGSQVGVPSYFMPEEEYSPMWHIGFAHWLTPAIDSVGVVKGLEQVKELRAKGELEVLEFPPPANIGLNNYDFENLNSPHVVNCPVPMTVDKLVHDARNAGKGD